jgi:hypothetical protein
MQPVCENTQHPSTPTGNRIPQTRHFYRVSYHGPFLYGTTHLSCQGHLLSSPLRP